MIFAMLPPHRTVPALCALLLAGCTSHTAASPQLSATSPNAAPSASAPSSAPPAVAARLAVPPPAKDEISRVTYSGKPDTIRHVMNKVARAGRSYTLVAACVSDPPGEILKYTILSSHPTSNALVASSDVTCDDGPGELTAPLPGTAVQIMFGPDMKGVTSAYAIIRPAAVS